MLCLALFVAIEGGFVVWPAGIRVSVKSEWRVLGWAFALLVARHFFVRDFPLHRRFTTRLREAARSAGPLRDDVFEADREQKSEPAPRRLLFYTTYAAAVLVLYTLLAVLMTYPQVRYLDSAISLDQGDALFSTWRLAWVAHQLPRDPLRLFDANIFYPERGTLAFSDAMIVPSLMGAPLFWLGVPRIAAYNLVFLSGFVLSGAAMFLLVRSLTHRAGAAFVAGFVFAFLPYRFMHYAHLELQMSMWMPLCLWAFHRTVTRGGLSNGLMTGLFLALQCLSSWYYGIFLATFLVPFGLALLVGEGAGRAGQSARALAAGGVLAAALTLPMAMPYMAARASVGERPVNEIEFYSATARNYLAAHPRNVMFGGLTPQWGGQERELFMGIVVPLLALVGLWAPLSAVRIAYVLGLVVAFEISLGFNGVLHPWLHEVRAAVPGPSCSRENGDGRRDGALGVRRLRRGPYHTAGAQPAARAHRRRDSERARLCRVSIDANPRAREDAAAAHVRVLPAGSDSILLELPLVQPDLAIEPVYMYFSTFHWRRLVNGYSGFSPPSYQVLLEKLAGFPDDESVAELRRRGVTHVTVHGAFFRHSDYVTLVSRLDRSSDLRLVTAERWARAESRLYQLVPLPRE